MKRLYVFIALCFVAFVTLECTKDRPTDPTQQPAASNSVEKRNRPSVYRVGGCSFHSIERVGQFDTLVADNLMPRLASCDTIFFAAADTFDFEEKTYLIDSLDVLIMGGTDPSTPLLKSTYDGSGAVFTFDTPAVAKGTYDLEMRNLRVSAAGGEQFVHAKFLNTIFSTTSTAT